MGNGTNNQHHCEKAGELAAATTNIENLIKWQKDQNGSLRRIEKSQGNMSITQTQHTGEIKTLSRDVKAIRDNLPSTAKIVGWIISVLVLLQAIGLYLNHYGTP